MKKNTLIIITGIIVNIIILGIIFYITNNKEIKANNDFIYMDNYGEIKKVIITYLQIIMIIIIHLILY